MGWKWREESRRELDRLESKQKGLSNGIGDRKAGGGGGGRPGEGVNK